MIPMLHTGLRVHSIEETKKFYKEIFGLEVAQEYTTPTAKCAFLKAGSTIIELVEKNEPLPAPSELIHLAFKADDIHRVVENLKAYGIRLDKDSYPYSLDKPIARNEGFMFFFNGPNGETIELCENVAIVG